MTHEPTLERSRETAELSAPQETGAPFDRELLTANYGWVQAVAYNLEHDRSSAEDVTQETLLAALTSPPKQVADVPHLRAWLGRVAFNLSRLGARQNARRRAREERVARSEVLPSVCESIEAQATLASLTRAIQSLPESSRGAVVMRYFEGLSTGEIARRTGTTELGVRKRLWRARDKLRATLEREFGGERRLRALAPLFLLRRGFGKTAVRFGAGLAAAAAVTMGPVLWRASLERERAPELVLAASTGRLAAEEVLPAQGQGAERPGRTSAVGAGEAEPSSPTRVAPLDGPRPPRIDPADAPPPNVLGSVLDLEGRPRADLVLFDAEERETPLGTTDRAGSFAFRAPHFPLQLVACAPGWTTVFPGRVGQGGAEELLLVVAPAQDLGGRVLDARGAGLGAELEILCDESAWVALDRPVRLDSPRIAAFTSDVSGAFLQRDVPRAAGFRLRVTCPGYEPVERDTLELGGELRLVLQPLPAEQELSGLVLHRDGRPAAGASVRLAEASAVADARGRYRLPLRGVRSDSVLEASDRSAATVRVRDFGDKLKRDAPSGDVDIVLGEEHVGIVGELALAKLDPTADWRVVLFPASAGAAAATAEAPAADLFTDEQGRFEVHLPAGAYDLYALAPDGLRLARARGLDSATPRWSIAVPAVPELEPVAAHVRSDEGRSLAGARVEVLCRLDGSESARSVAWRAFETDGRGNFAFRGDPALTFEARVESPGWNGWSGSGRPGSELAVVLQRPSFLRVAGADAGFDTLALLDEAGTVLTARGPLHASTHAALLQGRSAVVQVPPETRWVQVQGAGAVMKVPVAPRAGEVLVVRP